MNRGETSDSIPIDLIIEIFLRLPSKSIARFRCVSKLWDSMLHRPYFTELFLTRSLARPRLLFAVKQHNGWIFYSSPQTQNPYEKPSSSFVVAADFHMKFPQGNKVSSCGYASGLLCLSYHDNSAPVICNPNTGQYTILPELFRGREGGYKIGFDPIDKQFKVLFSSRPFYRILTLGTAIMKWRKIQYPLINHEPFSGSQEICINGVLYYIAQRDMVVCFDLRSEKFNFIDVGEGFWRWYTTKLVNYKGKLGLLTFDATKLLMLVLEDVETREWSKYVYTLPKNESIHLRYVTAIVGVTVTGEIVLSTASKSNRFYVYYFNPERNTLQTVEIQGLRAGLKASEEVYTFVDHVEDLNLNDAKLLSSSIFSPSLKNKRKCQNHNIGKKGIGT